MHYIKVYIDKDIKNITTGIYNDLYARPVANTPEVLRAMICDPYSGKVISERFLTTSGKDETGEFLCGYINCGIGEYNLLVYNWDTEITNVKNEFNYFNITAYTNISRPVLKAQYGEDVYYAPDLLYVCNESITVKDATKIDTLKTISGNNFVAKSIVEAFYFQIPLRNFEYCAHINATISGMAKEKFLIGKLTDPESIILEADIYKGEEEDDITYVYGIATTFGYIDGEDSNITLIYEVLITDGSLYTIEIDITNDIISSIENETNWIIIDKIYDIPIPDDGEGFRPGLDDWEDEMINIQI